MQPLALKPKLCPSRRFYFSFTLFALLLLFVSTLSSAATLDVTETSKETLGDAAQDTGSNAEVLLLSTSSGSDQVAPAVDAQPKKDLDLNVDKCDSPTVVTDETGVWRQLDEDEGMPVGAHVRLDMSGCGKNYIKVDPSSVVVDAGEKGEANEGEELVASDGRGQNGSAVGGEGAAGVVDPVAEFEEMERVLKELPEPDERLSEVAKLREKDPEAYEKAVRLLWERRQEELLKAFESLADEVQIMRDFLQVLATHNASEAEMLHSLQELEGMVQNIDTAQDFAALDGLQVVATKLIDENPRIRTHAAYVIGSACKLDHALQKRARELGVLALLHDQLERSWAVNTEESNAEAAKVLYAISALIRGSPENQLELASSSFVPILQNIIETGWDEVGIRVRVKAVTLLDDVLHMNCEGMSVSPDIVVVPLGDSENTGSSEGEDDQTCRAPSLLELIDVTKLCNTVQSLLSRFGQRNLESDSTFIEKLEALHTTARCTKNEH